LKSREPQLKLLVVEDDLASLELMAEVFGSLHADVHTIYESTKAAAVVNQEKFDGIFLDLEMPGLHGLDLARLIRDSSWNRSTPIIIVTGQDERKTMQQAFTAGATFFLQKPVDRQKLTGLFRVVRGGLLESRRRHLRVPLQTEITCTVGSRGLRGHSWNLSHGGMQIRLPVSEVAVEATASVVWVNPNRQGIRFTNISEQDQQAIRAFVGEEHG
jgi:CheY-like chemotaxis protein